MSQDDDYLFKEGDLSDFLRQRTEQMQSEIYHFSSEYVLKVSLNDLGSHLVEKYRLEPIVLLHDQIHIAESGDTKLEVTGDARYDIFNEGRRLFAAATFADFAVPFVGDASLLKLKPSTFNYNWPRAKVVGQELRFRCTRTDHDHAAMRADFDREIQNTACYVAWGTADVEKYNRNLQGDITNQLESRKQKFLKDQGLVEALGFPIKPRQGASPTYMAPIARKKVPIEMPRVSSGSFRPEPALATEHYEHILRVISSIVPVMERSPRAFVKMGEEDLRTQILVQLNGHYEGQATGETFNYEGKTDILIRADGRNLFIAECKIWKGAEVFTSTIDQLLGYLAWRDTKAAIVLFSRNKNLSEVLAQIPDLVRKHPNFKREVANANTETTFRYILHHKDDKNRELTLTVLVFDVPT
jgi:hypothetical protein